MHSTKHSCASADANYCLHIRVVFKCDNAAYEQNTSHVPKGKWNRSFQNFPRSHSPSKNNKNFNDDNNKTSKLIYACRFGRRIHTEQTTKTNFGDISREYKREWNISRAKFFLPLWNSTTFVGCQINIWRGKEVLQCLHCSHSRKGYWV